MRVTNRLLREILWSLKEYLEVPKFYAKFFGTSKYLVREGSKFYTRKCGTFRYFFKDDKIACLLNLLISLFYRIAPRPRTYYSSFFFISMKTFLLRKQYTSHQLTNLMLPVATHG